MFIRQSAKPVVFDSLYFRFAITRKFAYLSNVVAFFDPKVEPMFFIMFLITWTLPNKSSMTV